MDTITGMKTFVAVARQQSFTAGAKTLGISTKLSSKYVQQLEEHLGAQLLNRTTRSVTLTDTGEVYLERCVQLLDQIDELEGLVQEHQSELAGTIRITAPTGFGGTLLVDTLRPFQALHPSVSIDLHLVDHHVPLVEEGFDLAIRFGELQDSNLIARKLLNMRAVCVASPDYLKKYGKPTHPQELSQHNCLVQKSGDAPHRWLFDIKGKKTFVAIKGSFRANSPLANANMSAGGLGISKCPMYAVEPLINNGALEIILENYESTVLNLYAVYPQSRHLTARVRNLVDFLSENISNESERYTKML